MEYITVLLPSVGVGLLFFFVMRSIVMADRRERAAMEEHYRMTDSPAESNAEATPCEQRADEGGSEDRDG